MTKETIEVSRRTLLGAAAFAGVLGVAMTVAMAQEEEAAVTGPAPDLGDMPRVKVELVAPPFIHAHEQVATSGPKVVE